MASVVTTPLPRDPKTGRLMARGTAIEDPIVPEDSEEQQPPDEAETDTSDPRDADESVEDEPADETEAQGHRAAITRVTALLTEALRLGTQYGLVTKRPDGSIALPGMQPAQARESSECPCQQCGPHHQQHWWCMVCNSGPHDWLLNKPQFERQTLKPGGIEGVRHACCTAQCAREYMMTIGRQPAQMPERRQIDTGLALPLTGT